MSVFDLFLPLNWFMQSWYIFSIRWKVILNRFQLNGFFNVYLNKVLRQLFHHRIEYWLEMSQMTMSFEKIENDSHKLSENFDRFLVSNVSTLDDYTLTQVCFPLKCQVFIAFLVFITETSGFNIRYNVYLYCIKPFVHASLSM